MEREPEVELNWPVNASMILTVSLPGNLKNHTEQPRAEDAKAFIIEPGQIVIMHPGTWHYAALPATTESVFYYFLTKDHPREPGWENVAWIPFAGNKAITISIL